MLRALRGLVGLASLLAFGCSTSPPTGADGGDAAAPLDAVVVDARADDAQDVTARDAPVDARDASLDAGPPRDVGCATTPSFAEVYETVLSGCGGKIACHTRPPYGAGLDLSSAASARAGLRLGSMSVPDAERVVPGDAARSVLYRKLVNDLARDGSEGRPMPITMLATGWSRLPAERLELVRCWIDTGARTP